MHFLYYHDGHYLVYDIAAGKSTNITSKLPCKCVDEEDDHNFDKPAHPPVGWSRDSKFVLLSDGWDIWRVSIDGSSSTNLTENGKTSRNPSRESISRDRFTPRFTANGRKRRGLAGSTPRKPA
jgi:Tol biopolymer transport system component